MKRGRLGRHGLSNYVVDWNFHVGDGHIIDSRDYPDDFIADIELLSGYEDPGQRLVEIISAESLEYLHNRNEVERLIRAQANA